MPFLYEQFVRDPLEVAFVYPHPDRSSLDAASRLTLVMSVTFIEIVSFVICIIAGIGILKKERWAWFVALGLHLMSATVHVIASSLLPPYASGARLASMARQSCAHFLQNLSVRAWSIC
jgi:hypothetical protein